MSKQNTWPLWFGVPGKLPLHLLGNVRAFRRKVPISFERGNFSVKTIESAEELEKVLQLRYAVFHREYKGKLFPVGIDWEALDPVADHLVIVDRRTGKFVGTYRLISSEFSRAFYSGSEFELEEVFELPGAKVELSRACVKKEFRNGMVLSLLWRGLTEYFRAVGAEYVFGCCSVQTMDPAKAWAISQMLVEEKFALGDVKVKPTPPYEMFGHAYWQDRSQKAELPPLFKAYLKAGARVAVEPALDRDFRCIDFFTLLEVKNLNQRYEKKFG